VRGADARIAAAAYLAIMQRSIAIPRVKLGPIHWNQDYADVALALVLTGAALVSAVTGRVQIDYLSVPLLILQTLPLAWRRQSPIRILWITGSAITLYSLLGYHDSIGGVGVFVAFYTVAANEPRHRATLAAAVTAGGIFISFAAYAALSSLSGWTANLSVTYLSFGLAWVIGDNLRVRRAYTRELEERAVELEREREEQAALAVAQERGRIARELHDVVAHHVSVMIVQASAARRVAERDPAAAQEALAAIENAGRMALAEMRRMLEVLRAQDGGVGPQPGLADLERLISQVRDAGLPVELITTGDPCCLPDGMDLAAYRIVQEALTNTVKHGGKATAKVTVRHAPEALELEVVDNGRGAAAPLLAGAGGGGHGLIGMRERVGLFGGELQTGPVLPGGYRVWARLPLSSDDRARADRERALHAVAAAAVAAREAAETIDRGRTNRAKRSGSEPMPLVKPRVVPPMIGRVVPPRQTPTAGPGHPTRSRDNQP
jgi:signal transduction histidine kinase